jgi:hypothetical protein
MVSHSRASIRPDQLRPLNRPRPCTVSTSGGIPTQIIDRGGRYPVERVQDSWRLREEWWRTPIDRHYFELVMVDGRVRTVYRDVTSNEWFEQRG